MNALKVNNRCFALAIGLWVLLPSTAKCQTETVRQQIQAALQKGDASFQQKNVDGCLAMLTKDFQGADINGHHFGKAETKRSLVKEFSPRHLITQSDTIKSQVLSVTLSGSQANVMYHEHLVVTIIGQVTHHQDNLTFDALRRSVWVRTKGSWLERQEKGLTSRITQNGVLKSVKDSR